MRNIFFWFMLVLLVGFLYHIANDFIISEAIGEETTTSEEEELEPDCE